MKKIISVIAVVLIICTLACVLSACGSTIKGTYKDENLGYTLTFDKDNKVTGQLFNITVDGTYEIKDGKITISYSTPLGIGTTLTKSFEKDGDTIKIDNAVFEKVS